LLSPPARAGRLWNFTQAHPGIVKTAHLRTGRGSDARGIRRLPAYTGEDELNVQGKPPHTNGRRHAIPKVQWATYQTRLVLSIHFCRSESSTWRSGTVDRSLGRVPPRSPSSPAPVPGSAVRAMHDADWRRPSARLSRCVCSLGGTTQLCADRGCAS
jgi:hypothetical protein